MAKRFLVLIALLMLGFFIAGCAEGDKSGTVTNPNPDVFAPTGSISGVVFDFCLKAPVTGATVSVAYSGGVHKVVTDATGAFSFTGIPAIGKSAALGDATPYYVTCDLTTVTAVTYGYATVMPAYVVYNDLGDGTNAISSEALDATAFVESGSGASTPVNGLAATVNFQIAQPTATITGNVYDVTTGLAAAPTGTSVYLYDGYGSLVAPKATPDSNGVFTFSNVPPLDPSDSNSTYSIQVVKSGYDYVWDDLGDVVSARCADKKCGLLELTCPVGCNTYVSGIVVNIWSNPVQDITVPYITNVNMGSQTNVFCKDFFPTLAPADVTNFVITFSEPMAAYHRSTSNNDPVDLASCFTVVVTSAGSTNGKASIRILKDFDIIKSFAVSMAVNATTMSVTPTLYTNAELAAIPLTSVDSTNFNYGQADPKAAWPGATVQILAGGTFTLAFEEDSPRLTDANLVPWIIGTPGEKEHGYLHALGEKIQDSSILGYHGHHVRNYLEVTIGTEDPTAYPQFAKTDTTPPWIASILVPGGHPINATTYGGGTLYGDAIDPASNVLTPVSSIALNFNEVMSEEYFDQSQLVLTSSFTVLLTSSGATSGGNFKTPATLNILDTTDDAYTSYTPEWSANFMNLTLLTNVLDADAIAKKAGKTWGTGASVIFEYGTWTLTQNSPSGSLFDLAVNAWTISADPSDNSSWQASLFHLLSGTTYQFVFTQGDPLVE